MAVIALNSLYIAVAASTSGGTAPGGASAPTGCSLSTPSDLSSWVTAVENGADLATQDSTTMGSGGYTAMVAGLKSGVLNLSLLNDYASSSLNALIGMNGSVIAFGGTGFVEVRLTSSSRSATNPGFICKVLHNGWRSFNASVGAIPTVTWNPVIVGGFAELTA